PRLQIVKELRLLVGLVLRVRQTDVEGQNVVWLQSAVDVLQTPQTLNQQARRNEQHDGNRQLTDGEHAAHAIAPAAVTRAACTVFERFDELRLRRMKRRKQTKDQSGENCHAERKSEHAQ